MAKSFERIGSVSRMESMLPKKSEDDTLWEGEELALRYLLEDGKMNLCLRMLEDYKDAVADEHRREAMEKCPSACRKFETGAGVALLYAWHHLEAVQTTDLPLLSSTRKRY